MKKLLFIAIITLMLFSCGKPGETSISLSGNEQNLPEELKGLKVYTVWVEGGNNIKVAILPGRDVISTEYSKGKTNENVIVVGGNYYDDSKVIFEDSGLIIIKK